MFRIFLGAALALSACLWALAMHSGGSAVEFRTAAQIFGWSCLASILLGFLATAGRRHGFKLRGRPSLALVGASGTTLLTGVAVLYVSYFEWGNPPRWIDAQAETARPSVDGQQYPKSAEKPLVISTGFRATSAPEAKPPVPEKRPAPKVAVAAAPSQPRVQVDSDENTRGEYCQGPDASDPACPSVIPSSPTY